MNHSTYVQSSNYQLCYKDCDTFELSPTYSYNMKIHNLLISIQKRVIFSLQIHLITVMSLGKRTRPRVEKISASRPRTLFME